MARKIFLVSTAFVLAVVAVLQFFWDAAPYLLILFLPLIVLGFYDMLQTKRSVLRNFPVIGHGRFIMEAIRPELQQYFVESNTSGTPINRENRSIVYQRAKGVLQTLPFGTQSDVYSIGYEWIGHSIFPKHVEAKNLRVTIGGSDCKSPYSASLFNISAMSFGSISTNAVKALNIGAKNGGFYHNTGEGGLSPYHREHGGDVVWQIGTGYFGCREADGKFSNQLFMEKSRHASVKMIEIKISQGAKPSHGGILPAKKLTREIADIRGVLMGMDVLSPPMHTAFEGPDGLVDFIARLRELSGGKPVGFKICIGDKKEFEQICDTMISKDIFPDFITVDGGEGGTGAAPLEFANSVGMPLVEGLCFVNDTLIKKKIRNKLKIIAAGKILTGFHLLKVLALGADLANSARGMMLALGCIQALRCNTNLCPVGITTNDPGLVVGLVVPDKAIRVEKYHRETIKAFAELLGAMGLENPSDLRRSHINRRISLTQVATYEDIYPSTI